MPLDRAILANGRTPLEYRRWLKKNEPENYKADWFDELAIISHYIQNRNHPEGDLFREYALPLMHRYYRFRYPERDMALDITEETLIAEFADLDNAPLRHIQNDRFTFIDLFAGIGGFRSALQNVGGRCVFASEFDKAAQHAYAYNYGVIPFGDITRPETKAAIPLGFDVLCAGFPCQPFSMAGLREGFANQAKGTLFFDVLEILQQRHPRAFILENVPGLLSHDHGNTIRVIMNSLRGDIAEGGLGYLVPEPIILNAADFGCAQNRDRVFIVGFAPDEVDAYNHFVFPDGHEMPQVNFGDIMEQNSVDKSYYMSDRYWRTLIAHREREHKNGRGYGYAINNVNEPGHTLLTGGMGLERNLVQDFRTEPNAGNPDNRGYLNEDHIRVLTENECKRMQGFPDEFEIVVSRHAAYKQFGNSVAVPVIQAIALAMQRALMII